MLWSLCVMCLSKKRCYSVVVSTDSCPTERTEVIISAALIVISLWCMTHPLIRTVAPLVKKHQHFTKQNSISDEVDNSQDTILENTPVLHKMLQYFWKQKGEVKQEVSRYPVCDLKLWSSEVISFSKTLCILIFYVYFIF